MTPITSPARPMLLSQWPPVVDQTLSTTLGVMLSVAVTGGADRNRTDGYGICSPGPYHLATAPCIDVVEYPNYPGRLRGPGGGAGDGI